MAMHLTNGARRHGEITCLVARTQDVAIAAVIKSIGNGIAVRQAVDSAAYQSIAGELEIPHQVRHRGRAVRHRDFGQRSRRHVGPKGGLEGLVTVDSYVESWAGRD